MGFHGKQVPKAGELIGMGRSTALLCYGGEHRVTKTVSLPWPPPSQVCARGSVPGTMSYPR